MGLSFWLGSSSNTAGRGLTDYGFEKRAKMVYGWFWLIARTLCEYNGTMPEKFDLETSSHKVFAEYGKCRAGLIIFLKRDLVGLCILPIWFRCLMLI
jgi:hypothetical protein